VHINIDNCSIGNQAMAWVFLLYYHLLREGGITDDQTVYVGSFDLDAFQLCLVEVDAQLEPEIDGRLIREGAVIHILCDLNDCILEYEGGFLNLPFVQKIFAAYEEGRLSAIPEAAGVFRLISTDEARFDYAAYKAALASIFMKYVVERMARLIAKN
jgi:hypothetical protein